MPSNASVLILASTSPYRRGLLERLQMPFQVVAPDVYEAPLPAEAPSDLAMRLALEKARNVSRRHPGATVIGSDQVADLDGTALGKPGDRAGCLAQLQAMQGRSVRFHTAVAVVRDGVYAYEASALVDVMVRFRPLSATEIERYVDREQPYDCAGSAKVEALGIALLASVESDDPTALVGLPLIATCRLLRAAGMDPLARSGDGRAP